MKKKIYSILLFIIIFIIALTTKSLGYFEIDNFEINCYVQEDGDVKIEENITYRTNEYKNGVTRDIELKNEINTTNSANGFELESVKVNGVTYKRTYGATNGDSGVYEYTKGSDKYSLKVYTPFNKTGKTVTYTYLLKDVVVKYQDTAELYWNFIGSKWDTDINNVDINITLPEEAKKGTIYVYGHGSDNGTFEKTENYISLNAKNVQAYQAIDARILFSNAAVPYSTKNVNKEVLEKYINQEEGITANREEKEILYGLSVNEIAFILSIIIIIIGVYIYLRYTRKGKIQKAKYVRDIPANLEPELLQTIYYGKVCKDAFWITFLNLVRLGVYSIEKTVNEVGKETQKITFIKKVKGLEEHQEKVITIINRFMEDKSIDLIKLKAKFKRSSNSGYKVFENELISRKEELFGDERKVPKHVKTILYVSMAVLIMFIAVIGGMVGKEAVLAIPVVMFLGITTIIYSLIFAGLKDRMTLPVLLFLIIHCGMFQIGNISMISAMGAQAMYIPYVLLFILIQIVQRIVIVSKEERQMKEQIKGLRRFIRDYSMLEEKGIEHITLWEEYLVIAIALKLNRNTINYFYDYAKNNLDTNFGTSLVCVGTYNTMSRSFATTFNTYQQAYTSSSSSSGSSFSGSSGGFSGGSSSGGGGRRRWRRKLLLIRNFWSNFWDASKNFLKKYLIICNFLTRPKNCGERENDMLNILFMGTPDFAKESLKCLYEEKYNIIGVVTNPDKPKGRGMKMVASEVKEYAIEKNLTVYQPEKVRKNTEFIETMKRLNPDLIVVVAYGKILPKEILEIPKYGCINVHASLLPKYRGAAPIQWSVINGDKVTGVTTMYMDEGMDTGDIILKEEVEIGENETTGDLWDRLSTIGGKLLIKTVKQIEEGTAPRQKQPQDFTMAPMLDKEMSKINWEEKTANEIHNLVRGLNPIMGAYTFLNEKKIKFWKVRARKEDELVTFFPELEEYLFKLKDVTEGTILFANDKKGLFIKAKEGIIEVVEIQGENAKKMPVGDFLRGNNLMAGEIFE